MISTCPVLHVGGEQADSTSPNTLMRGWERGMASDLAVRSWSRNLLSDNERCLCPLGISNMSKVELRKLLIWLAISALVILAILLPVIVVTGMFGGEPLAGTVALIGLVLLAFGVAWYVRARGA
jgi:hypothetical protein